MALHPAVIVHGPADAVRALAPGRPITLLSARGAALYAGVMWWRALVAQATAAHPGVPVLDVLDCADAPGLALGAIRMGQTALILDATVLAFRRVAAIAGTHGILLLPEPPPALDLAARGAERRLATWLG